MVSVSKLWESVTPLSLKTTQEVQWSSACYRQERPNSEGEGDTAEGQNRDGSFLSITLPGSPQGRHMGKMAVGRGMSWGRPRSPARAVTCGQQLRTVRIFPRRSWGPGSRRGCFLEMLWVWLVCITHGQRTRLKGLSHKYTIFLKLHFTILLHFFCSRFWPKSTAVMALLLLLCYLIFCWPRILISVGST